MLGARLFFYGNNLSLPYNIVIRVEPRRHLSAISQKGLSFLLLFKMRHNVSQGGSDRAKYGDGLIKELSTQLTADFGRGFDERALRLMRQFYYLFPIWDSVSPELSWTHYRYELVYRHIGEKYIEKSTS